MNFAADAAYLLAAVCRRGEQSTAMMLIKPTEDNLDTVFIAWRKKKPCSVIVP
jgi:hypothetical protein